MALQLKALMGTRYIYDGLIKEFRDTIARVPAGETLDLCDCKFGVACESVLRSYYGVLNLIDSKNEYNAMVLEMNKKVAQIGSIPTVTLRNSFSSPGAIIDYIQYLDEDKIYDIKNYMESPVFTISLVILITLLRPSIKIMTGEHTAEIFNQVRLDWLGARSSHYDAYNEVVGAAIITKDVVNGQVYVPGYGMVEEDIYIQRYPALPIEFGTTRLYENPEYQNVVLVAVENIKQVKEAPQKMKDYIEGNRG